ncbi:chitinase-like protein 1 [Cucurbita moschata]|uniref:Chitinase-like protein 1 n=1 Tax=Cucurbita moschata TaxID=3662 RepID=A0A6J1EX72_CUCMO|nr:chitinase-like protein 1 [Cucurbita moschata]
MAVNCSLLVILALVVMASVVSGDEPSIKPKVKIVKGKKLCDRGWECTWSSYCCNLTITDYFETYQFENLFSKRNSPVAHAVGFWDFHSFILAAAQFEPLGFGTTGDKKMQMKEIAAFLGHVGSKTSCGDGVVTGGPLAWGLCFNKEMSPSQDYCDDYFKLTYPCAPGAQYYGRGALPIFWNYNYGKIGDALKIDLLHHPEYVEQNATIAFQTAIWKWMNPVKKSQPSPHDVFVGNWKPTKNDTLSKRVPGFGTTMNILYGDSICGKGDIDPMNNIISHYLYYLDLMGLSRDEAGTHETLSCAEQIPFNPTYVAPAAAS